MIRGRRPPPGRRPAGAAPEKRERGSVTAELAVALPTLVLVLVVGIWLQSAIALRGRCVDAARAGARAAARGDAPATIRSQLVAGLPRGAEVEIARGAGLVTVTVRARTSPLAGFDGLSASLSAAASAADEATDSP